MAGRQEVCSTHDKLRNPRFLVQNTETGLWHCAEASPCITKIAPALEGRLDDSVATGASAIVDMCDLCNGDVKEGQTIDDHLLKYHATLVLRCNELEAMGSSLSAADKPAPSSLAALGASIREIAEKCDKGPATYDVTVQAAKQLSIILKNAFPMASVFTFGSCIACGCWDGQGDVDFTLVDPVGWQKREWPPADEGRVVLDIAKALRAAGFLFDDIEPLCRTRVPIVKHVQQRPPELWRVRDPKARTLFYRFARQLSPGEVKQVETQLDARAHHVGSDPKGLLVQFRSGEAALKALMLRNDVILPQPTRYDKRWSNPKLRPAIFEVDFDISCRAHGIRNSVLLRTYMEQSPVIRAGSVYVKTWSKKSGINNSMRGYLTSYAVNILWIYYLLQTGQATFVDPHSIPFSPDPATFSKYATHMEIAPKAKADPTFDQRVAEAVAGFFRFYAVYFDWKSNVVSINRPSVTTKDWMKWIEANQIHSKVFRERVWYHFCIEDPYEENLNLGRHVSSIKKHTVLTEFIFGLTSILSGNVKQVLTDRSSQSAAAQCLTGLRRAMIGKTERRLSDLVLALRRFDIDSLAAYEVEQRTTKLFDEGGYTINNDPDPLVTIPASQVAVLHIPAEAQPLIDELDAKFKRQPYVGESVTSQFKKYNLHLIYFVEDKLQRCFANVKDAAVYVAHNRAVVSAVEDLEQDGINWVKEHLLGQVIERVSVPFNQDVFDVVADQAILNQKKAVAAASSSSGGTVKRSSKPPIDGTCDDCSRRGKIWRTNDVSIDPGMYCDTCWVAFENPQQPVSAGRR